MGSTCRGRQTTRKSGIPLEKMRTKYGTKFVHLSEFVRIDRRLVCDFTRAIAAMGSFHTHNARVLYETFWNFIRDVSRTFRFSYAFQFSMRRDGIDRSVKRSKMQTAFVVRFHGWITKTTQQVNETSGNNSPCPPTIYHLRADETDDA